MDETAVISELVTKIERQKRELARCAEELAQMRKTITWLERTRYAVGDVMGVNGRGNQIVLEVLNSWWTDRGISMLVDLRGVV